MDEPINIYKLITSVDNRKRNEGYILLYEDEMLNNFVKGKLARAKLNDVELHDLLTDGLEVLQEKILNRDYRGEGMVQTFLYRVYENKIKDIIRKKKRRKTDSVGGVSEDKIMKLEEVKEREIERKEIENSILDSLWKDIEKLRPNCQELLRNRFIEGLKNGKIAAMVGHANPHQTSKAISRCLGYLRRITSENPFYQQFQNNKK